MTQQEQALKDLKTKTTKLSLQNCGLKTIQLADVTTIRSKQSMKTVQQLSGLQQRTASIFKVPQTTQKCQRSSTWRKSTKSILKLWK